jgi:hypothetical protein
MVQTLDRSSAMVDLHGFFCSLIFPDFSRLSLDSQGIKSEGVSPVFILVKGNKTALAKSKSIIIPCFLLGDGIIVWDGRQEKFPKILDGLLLGLHCFAPLMFLPYRIVCFKSRDLKSLLWCPKPDLNWYATFAARDFKSPVSADSTIRAFLSNERLYHALPGMSNH